jgi:hypothetical protein
VASALAPIIVVLMILFGGFYINVDSLPAALAWLQYLSIMRWAFMGLAVNEFTGTTFSCGDVADGDGCTSTGEEVGGWKAGRSLRPLTAVCRYGSNRSQTFTPCSVTIRCPLVPRATLVWV